jgi:hypothetical protein
VKTPLVGPLEDVQLLFWNFVDKGNNLEVIGFFP